MRILWGREGEQETDGEGKTTEEELHEFWKRGN